jgi:hypothetical protein
MLPYNAKTGRKLRREGAFVEKDFGKYTAWLPNPPPHAYSDDPAHASGRPLKRTGAGIEIEVDEGEGVGWLPRRPPPSGFYGRSYRDPTPSTSTTPVNPASSAAFLGQGSSTSDNVQRPPSRHNPVPPPFPIPEGVDIDDLELEYVDDPSLVAPPIAATSNLAAPSSSWVLPPMPETPTPASRTHRHNGAIGELEGAPAPSADTRKRSRDDDDDDDESLRPTSRLRSSSVPLPGPSRRLPMLPLSPPRVTLAAASSSSSASSQTATTIIDQASPEAPPLRRSSRLARAAKKLRK